MTSKTSRRAIFGYHGQYLHIDLSGRPSCYERLEETDLRRFIGGVGLGTFLALRHNAATIDPLTSAAPLVLAFGPLVGSPVTTTAKFAIVSRSPLTQRINDSLVSGGFALAAKRCGCDAIVIHGRAVEPSTLVIDDGVVQLLPATELWGQSSEQTERILKRQLGSDFEIASIGPAGENQVHYATISHARRHAGRGGSGAVLGAKYLKAIAVRGSQRCRWADPQGLMDIARQLSAGSLGPATAKYRELGTVSNLLVLNRLHALPTHNFQSGNLDGLEELSAESLSETRSTVRRSCVACTIGCEHIFSIRAEPIAPETPSSSQTRMEYENLFALGPLCGVRDPEHVLTASKRCDELGLDTISTGGSIAFGMECVEKGLLDEPWLKFGSGQAVLRAIELIASREELGDLLADGTREMSRRVGNNSAAFAPHVKGLEIPGFEPRSMQHLALGMAVGTRGADHNRSGAAEVDFSSKADRHRLSPKNVPLVIEQEDKAALLDALILCRFLRNVFSDLFAESAELLHLVTGWDVDREEIMRSAQRIVTARKLFNIRSGWTPSEDTLPERFLQTQLPDDPDARLTADQLQAAIRAYNVARGWSDQGGIPGSVVKSLDLADL